MSNNFSNNNSNNSNNKKNNKKIKMADSKTGRMLTRDQGVIPKPKFYLSDGTGRDTYIHIDSGGLVSA